MCDDNLPFLSVIGTGPGDPELISIKGMRLIRSAQVIFAPCSALKKDSLALDIVRGALESAETGAEIVNQVYPMTRDQKMLSDFWDKAAIQVKEKLAGGKRGVFITLGDPSIYSTWSYLRPRVESLNIPYEIVPGIASFLLGAARVRRELTLGEERLAMVPMPHDRAELEHLLNQFDTLVLMKIGRALGRLREMLSQSGYLERAWIIFRCGLREERIMPMNEIDEETLGYLSHVIIYKESRRGEDAK